MATHVWLYKNTYARAQEIGEEMAADPAIKPHLRNVAQYSGYYRFRLAHRAYQESTRHYERHYQERIYALADREARQRGSQTLDAAVSWETWYHALVHPIKTIIWQTWEKRLNLEARYLDALLTSGAAGPADIRRMTSSREPDPDEIPSAQANKSGIVQATQRFLAELAGGLHLFRKRPAYPAS